MITNKAVSMPFLRLYALAFLFFSANSILNVIVPLRSEALGASNGQIGWIMGAYMFTCMFFRPWAGHLIRKYGPVTVLRCLLVVNGLALVMYAFSGLEGYFAARVVQGICTAFFSMSLQLGIIDSLPEEQRAQGLSMYSLFTYMPTIVGPLLAIGIWDWGGISAFTFAMIMIALVTGTFGYSVPMQSGRQAEKVPAAQEGIGSGFRQLAANRPLLVCSSLMLLASAVFGAVTAFIPLYARQIAYGYAGFYLMLQAFTVVAARFTLGKRIPSDGRWHPRFVGSLCLFAAAGAGLLSLSQTAGPVLFYAAAVLLGLAQALLYPTLTSYLTFALPAASRNVLIGLFIATADLGIAMGGMAMGPVADKFSYSTMYAACAVLAAFAVCAAWISRMKRTEGNS
ncbi:MFS transporter [Paenibacillus sp. N4]|uniref:staphylopine family metallophore export MFS transporter CntE n=1 Tax=Paenibacillus vietnamensis TaxID=2590547 RepID=UPI001CD17F10|nr:MFS transporter [Paenibacillus vietnamensis]MCA0756638.1 MFS transporter [Paenibacillus vietnamensis]